MLLLKVKLSPNVTYLNVVKTLMCQEHSLIWSAVHYDVKWVHLISHSKSIFSANEN